MKTLITAVTIQVSEVFNTFTVFTDYKKGESKYDGFNPYKTLEKAIEVAEDLVNTCNSDFMSTAKGYTIITFKEDGIKEDKFINKK